MAEWHTIFGPPGTGKTTRLVEVITQELDRVDPAEIACLAFTRKAAEEIRTRAGVPASHWFRTIHSLAFACTGMSREDVMSKRHFRMLERHVGFRMTLPDVFAREDLTVEDYEEMSIGRGLLNAYDYSRIHNKSIHEAFLVNDKDAFTFPQLEFFIREYEAFKQQHHLSDFTDMLLQAMGEDHTIPRLKVIIVDEAQDLSDLQWKLVNRVVEVSGAERIYVAGDDDQAIFKWAGGRPEIFMNLEGTREVLPQSYRVPLAIANLSKALIEQTEYRVPKEWRPRPGAPGRIEYPLDYALDYGSGEWLLLARTRQQTTKYMSHCYDNGWLFADHAGPSIRPTHLDAIVSWERIRKKRGVKGDRARAQRCMSKDHILNSSGERYLANKPWYQVLDMLPKYDQNYIRACLSNGENPREPRIRVLTFHQAKGLEADNVSMMLDVSTTVSRSLELPHKLDDERRTFYVGMTRAREQLLIVEPQTRKHFDLHGRKS